MMMKNHAYSQLFAQQRYLLFSCHTMQSGGLYKNFGSTTMEHCYRGFLPQTSGGTYLHGESHPPKSKRK